MAEHLIISVISDDKPGVVKAIADVVSREGGNWLESRLAQLAGKFAGVIRVAVDAAHRDALCQALTELNRQGIKTSIDAAEDGVESQTGKSAAFTVVGPDRKGIVYEISHAFAEYGINVEELSTHYTSMPYSGEPLFEAEGMLTVPEATDWDKLRDQLDEIADKLAVDFTLD